MTPDENKGFTMGVVYSCAQLIRMGAIYQAEHVWRESGFSPCDLDHADDYDSNELKKHIPYWGYNDGKFTFVSN